MFFFIIHSFLSHISRRHILICLLAGINHIKKNRRYLSKTKQQNRNPSTKNTGAAKPCLSIIFILKYDLAFIHKTQPVFGHVLNVFLSLRIFLILIDLFGTLCLRLDLF